MSLSRKSAAFLFSAFIRILLFPSNMFFYNSSRITSDNTIFFSKDTNNIAISSNNAPSRNNCSFEYC